MKINEDLVGADVIECDMMYGRSRRSSFHHGPSISRTSYLLAPTVVIFAKSLLTRYSYASLTLFAALMRRGSGRRRRRGSGGVSGPRRSIEGGGEEDLVVTA